MAFPARDPRNLRKVSYRIAADDVAWVDLHATCKGLTASEVVRKAIAAYRDQQRADNPAARKALEC